MPIFVQVLLAVFVAIGLGLLAHGLRTVWKAREPAAWPTTEGTLLARELKQDTDAEGTTYRVDVAYSYSVAGKTYESRRLAFGYGGTSGRLSHQQLYDRLMGGSTVVVRYDPARPGEAVLAYGLSRSTVFILIFGATWTLFCIGMYALTYAVESPDTVLLSRLIVK